MYLFLLVVIYVTVYAEIGHLSRNLFSPLALGIRARTSVTAMYKISDRSPVLKQGYGCFIPGYVKQTLGKQRFLANNTRLKCFRNLSPLHV